MKFCFTDLAKFKFPHFPLLELDDGNHIFSSDAIIKYILPNEKPLELRDQVKWWFFSSIFHEIKS